MSERFHGRGLSFPLRVNENGLGESAGVAKVEESIRIILGTRCGERLMRPRFGCDLHSLAFAPNNASTANLARYHVTEALTRWEPRIEVLEVTAVNDNLGAALLIDIRYRLRVTQDVRNLVYPFYLERAR
ncbi:GPW/gp25 family protein [Amycolatopsis sp. cg5]|uniref:GPW/gp25 family protein n=1 Tax=Amycolatopsis sp. cg5 TaxID=3238802 RepID=UPI0035258936